MQYRTIIHELMRQRPSLYEELSSSNTLTSTLTQAASKLRDNHLRLVEQLRQEQPEAAEMQLKNVALEIAIEEFRQDLPIESRPVDPDPFPLDAAMAFIRRHTPPE